MDDRQAQSRARIVSSAASTVAMRAQVSASFEVLRLAQALLADAPSLWPADPACIARKFGRH